MNRFKNIIGYLFFAILILLTLSFSQSDWGFFGHRQINRMAVFTLPPELMILYKANIDYLTDHAVDADMRRYASKYEAIRHYIDLDHWGSYPFSNLPRIWYEALLKYSQSHWFCDSDTFSIEGFTIWEAWKQDIDTLRISPNIDLHVNDFVDFFRNDVVSQYYEETWTFSAQSILPLLILRDTVNFIGIQILDQFSEHGIVPYYLPVMKNRLTNAFQKKDTKLILRLSADLGHYVGDAHVPLHSTKNYNGQLTDQLGIHAFWESRLPELFAEKHYDFLVGKAEYIGDTDTYFWDIVFDSHALVDSVLLIEKELSRSFPSDQQYCYEDRLNTTVRMYCAEYAAAYHQRLSGQVEDRMRASIHAIGSLWYTCWVDAGQPEFGDINFEWSAEELAEIKNLQEIRNHKKIKGRPHN